MGGIFAKDSKGTPYGLSGAFREVNGVKTGRLICTSSKEQSKEMAGFLVEQAQSAFTNLDPQDISVGQIIDSKFNDGHMGIEFEIKDEEVHKLYLTPLKDLDGNLVPIEGFEL